MSTPFTVLETKTVPIESVYTMGKQLGQPGQFGVAKLAVSIETGEEVAIKVISKTRFFKQRRHREKYIEAFRSEIRITRSLNHNNIIKLYDVYEDEHDLYLVMGVCKGGELFERIQSKGSYNEKDASSVVRMITEALSYLHSHKIAHCDLKPDNFLFMDDSEDSPIKVIDFGMSKFIERRKYHRQLCGTPYYIAPEVIDGKYNEACDMWSIGVVLFVMLFGFPPFWADPEKYGSLADDRIYQLIKKGFRPITQKGYGAFFPEDIPITDSAKDLISKLLCTDVAERYTAEEALNHPWLRGDTASSDPISQLVVSSLKKFNSTSKFKQALLGLMTETLSLDQQNQVRATFESMDIDHDGTITIEELSTALSEVTSDELKEIFLKADIDSDGKLSVDELMVAFASRQIGSKEERMLKMFRRLDLNGDGKITADELANAVGDDQNIIELMKEVDQDGDGFIDYEEFIDAWGDIEAEDIKKNTQSTRALLEPVSPRTE